MLSSDWRSYGATESSFDDGHIPENLKDSIREAKIVQYDMFQQQEPVVHVYNDAFADTDIIDAIYTKTAGSDPESKGNNAWGDYVTIEQIERCWENSNANESSIVVKITAEYLRLALGEGTKLWKQYPPSKSNSQPLFSREQLKEVHGIAVWGLAASSGTSVPFHLDYAEQIRYERNIIVPPLLAGTLQCTKDQIDGGDFYVSLKGIPHYEITGYKAKRQPVDMKDPGVISLPYKYNQLTCHLGNLPHGSTKVEKIHGDQLRVIVGFNVFCAKSGPLVQLAPEHSDKFRRKVLGMKMFSQNVSLESIRKNKPLTRLLVMAKREKAKNEFRQSQETLKREILSYLPATVQELADRFCSDPANSSWPYTPGDLQMFIYDQVLKGEYRLAAFGDEPSSSKDSVSMTATVELVST
ncbi:unnamed protein product [Cylindrotheca closterium]|uniref:Uncharacterized protein n=1 Tax=Cylindrotheca closterium TaxID=2856 RepID=A0AAD2CSL1_9STRA|nr:unnamed protein product [Cylindrotheca closterium]